MAKYETTHTAFLGVDLDLLENPIYSDMDVRAAMLYALYKDRAHLSLYTYTQLGNNRYIDEHGVFIIFTNELAAKALHVSTRTIGTFRKQLVNHNLITIRRNGLKGYKIYVKEVQRTPKNVKLTLPWMNHYVEIKKSVSDWTLEAQIQRWKNVSLASNSGLLHEREVNDATCAKKPHTRLTPSSLTTSIDNNIDLIDNAPARAREIKPKSNTPYHTLPELVKKSFNTVFGFISTQVAIELHSLIDTSNADMVNYAILHSQDRKITSPIKYLKSIIGNALSKGHKCARDMQDYYENHFQGLKKPRKHYTKAQVEKMCTEEEQNLAQTNPTLFARIQEIKKRNAERKNNRPMIPIYHIGE